MISSNSFLMWGSSGRVIYCFSLGFFFSLDPKAHGRGIGIGIYGLAGILHFLASDFAGFGLVFLVLLALGSDLETSPILDGSTSVAASSSFDKSSRRKRAIFSNFADFAGVGENRFSNDPEDDPIGVELTVNPEMSVSSDSTDAARV